jgi:hypothetical protein
MIGFGPLRTTLSAAANCAVPKNNTNEKAATTKPVQAILLTDLSMNLILTSQWNYIWIQVSDDTYRLSIQLKASRLTGLRNGLGVLDLLLLVIRCGNPI